LHWSLRQSEPYLVWQSKVRSASLSLNLCLNSWPKLMPKLKRRLTPVFLSQLLSNWVQMHVRHVLSQRIYIHFLVDLRHKLGQINIGVHLALMVRTNERYSTWGDEETRNDRYQVDLELISRSRSDVRSWGVHNTSCRCPGNQSHQPRLSTCKLTFGMTLGLSLLISKSICRKSDISFIIQADTR